MAKADELTDRSSFVIATDDALDDPAKSAALADYVSRVVKAFKHAAGPPRAAREGGVREDQYGLSPERANEVVAENGDLTFFDAARSDREATAAAGRSLRRQRRDPVEARRHCRVRRPLQRHRRLGGRIMTAIDAGRDIVAGRARRRRRRAAVGRGHRAGPDPHPGGGSSRPTRGRGSRVPSSGSSAWSCCSVALGASPRGRLDEPDRCSPAPSTVVTVGWDLVRDGTLGLGAVGVAAAGAVGPGDRHPARHRARAARRAVPRRRRPHRRQRADAALRARSSASQPMLILWLGIGETAKITLIVLGVAFPVYVNTYTAIRSIDPRYLELADVVGLSRRRRRSGGSCCRRAARVPRRRAAGHRGRVAAARVRRADQRHQRHRLPDDPRPRAFFQSDVDRRLPASCTRCSASSRTRSSGSSRGRLLRWQPGR